MVRTNPIGREIGADRATEIDGAPEPEPLHRCDPIASSPRARQHGPQPEPDVVDCRLEILQAIRRHFAAAHPLLEVTHQVAHDRDTTTQTLPRHYRPFWTASWTRIRGRPRDPAPASTRRSGST